MLAIRIANTGVVCMKKAVDQISGGFSGKSFVTAFMALMSVVQFAFPQGISGQDALSPVAIAGVNVVDVEGNRIVEDQTILIDDGRITTVSASAKSPAGLPEGTLVIEAKGKYVIPGLWDMHIHWYDQRYMALFPVNGVTGVRVMFGSPGHHAWRKAFEEGTQLGPRMMIGSLIIDGPRPIWPGSIIAADAEGGKLAVQKSLDAGADFAKVYSLLSRDAYFSIMEEAKAKQLPVDGHVPMMVSVEEASRAGQRSMEHLYEFIISCSAREEELRALQRECIAESGQVRAYADNGDLQRQISEGALESFNQEKADRIFRVLAENRSWQCPTLTVLRNLTFLTSPEVQQNDNLKYVPKFVRAMIAPADHREPRDEAAKARAEARYRLNVKLLKQMHDAGVPILAGTDCLNPFCLPGFSIHTELELLVEAGLKPHEALATATVNAWKFQGKEVEGGTVAAGKFADLVLLNANPLEDIRNTKKIHTVVLRGKVLDQGELARLLESFRSE
jgi:Amidohydrolase family